MKSEGKKRYKLIYLQTEVDPQTKKTNLWLPKEKGRGRIN